MLPRVHQEADIAPRHLAAENGELRRPEDLLLHRSRQQQTACLRSHEEEMVVELRQTGKPKGQFSMDAAQR